METDTEAARANSLERFPIAVARERWACFAALEHETLPLPLDFALEADELIVWRAPLSGRRLGDGRVPSRFGPALFLQAAAALAFWAAHGIRVDEEDLGEARWDLQAGVPRLSLARSPAGIRSSGQGRSSGEVLAAFAERLFARRGGAELPSGAALRERLSASDATGRPPEFWVGTAYRLLPDLAGPPLAGARVRTLGYGGSFLRAASRRAVIAKARAALQGRVPRVFTLLSALRAGSALDLEERPRGVSEAAKWLRARHERESGGRKAAWIAVGRELWDGMSRRGFDVAARQLDAEVEIVEVPLVAPPPRLPDDWRREIWVPCGTLQASVRFYQDLAESTRDASDSALPRILSAVSCAQWAAFAGDPTGDTPPPFAALRSSPSAPRPAAASGPPGRRVTDPAERLERLLASGDVAAALEEGRRWIEAEPEAPPEHWYEISARLAAASGPALPPWLAALEAEREVAGGRIHEAEARLRVIEEDAGASEPLRRAAGLRRAELRVSRGDMRGAGEMAARWRREHSGAPAIEMIRALRVDAASRAREGEHEAAHRLLDRADKLAVTLAVGQRLENALVRAAVLSLQGRFLEEKQLYDSWRPVLARAGDDALMARLLAREALGLNDRREFGAAAARLEQASEILRDDPVERARALIDLAATYYHAGRPARCDALLEEAVACSTLAGREDLVRIARGNRLELLIDRGDWKRAQEESDALAASARAEGDDRRLLVALHQASRLALRRGELERAARENAQARSLAERLSDRLEIGELWLEEGDRLVYSGQIAAARDAYARAAADPPDRSDTDRRAAERFEELHRPDPDETPASSKRLEEFFARNDYAAAESVARRHAIVSHSGGVMGRSWRERAAQTLRTRGGGALADLVFGAEPDVGAAAPPDALRGLRLALARTLAGEKVEGALAPLGLRGLRVSEATGRELVALGEPPEATSEIARRRLPAGAATYELELWPAPPEPGGDAIGLLVETLLFRFSPPGSPSDHARGWLRFGIVAADAAMEEPYRRLCLFAPQPVTVLVLGESGTGKEAVARAVHLLSARGSARFVAVNVAAIPGALIESELFGHARGAFTGADRERRGLIEEADGGTIFFDEIGDLDLALQVKLLRALQEGEIRRVGESRPRRVDVRVISATARDLARDVSTGRFREDLYYRLHVAVIPLPPLRHRGRDVTLLARHFLERYAREYGRGSLQFAPEGLAALASHAWPGNVRELQNAVSQAVALADPNGLVTPAMLPEPVRRSRGASSVAVDYRSRVDAHRRDLICEALERTGGNRSRAARNLGISRQALLYLIRELKIPGRPGTVAGASKGAGRRLFP